MLAAMLLALSYVTTSAQAPVDDSPHKSALATVNGVTLHYLDWGGSGDTVLLLAGLGNDAHVFDAIAPRLTDRFHVIGLTRRGFGESSRPASGYARSARVEDIRAFLDAMQIPTTHVIGHLVAGEEMALLAALNPTRVGKLVYIEAAYDRANSLRMGLEDPAATPLNRWLITQALGAPQGGGPAAPPGSPPADVLTILLAYLRESEALVVDFAPITAPSLALFAVSDRHPNAPPQADAQSRRAMDAWWSTEFVPWQRARIEQFRRQQPRAEVVELRGSHFLFLGETEAETVRRIRDFLTR